MNGQQQQQQMRPALPSIKTLLQKSKRDRKQRPGKKQSRSNRPQSSSKTVSIPASQGTIRRVKDPQFSSGGRNGDIIVTHEEYIGDVNGSVAFTPVQYAVNPGLQGSFPWLAAIAPNYESYKFESLEYEFKTTTNNQATGNVALFLDYDPADAAPTSKREILNSESTMDGPAWSLSIRQNSKRENLNKRATYLVRQGNVGASASLTLYDVGNLFVCTQGQAGATVIGELLCRYRIRLMTPQMGTSGIGNATYAKISGTAIAGALTLNGNFPGSVSGTPAAMTLTSTGPYQGIVAAYAVGTTLNGFAPSGTATSSEIADVLNTPATNEAAEYLVNFTDVGQTFTLALTAATVSSYAVRIGQYLNSLA